MLPAEVRFEPKLPTKFKFVTVEEDFKKKRADPKGGTYLLREGGVSCFWGSGFVFFWRGADPRSFGPF